MNQLIARVLDRLDRATVKATTFCDECGQVCTPACRHEAQIDHYRQAVYRTGRGRF
ncbi:MAG TPA: hypothetical protein VFA78_06930 [Chloroflexota bacterium]|nr:hypothetical protein [Chloroflexota bacterium]